MTTVSRTSASGTTATGWSATGRLTASALALAVGVVAVSAVGLMLGSRALPLTDVLAALAGQDSGDASIIVWYQRLPRTLLGLLVGAALGIGGATAAANERFERNPLWKQPRGVKAGNVHNVPDEIWMTSVSAQGAQLVLDELAKTFGVDPARA